MAKRNPFDSAMRKLRHYSGRIWVGYLTPVEILALLAAGIQPNPADKHKVEVARQDKATGASTPTWFYCVLQDNQRPQGKQ